MNKNKEQRSVLLWRLDVDDKQQLVHLELILNTLCAVRCLIHNNTNLLVVQYIFIGIYLQKVTSNYSCIINIVE